MVDAINLTCTFRYCKYPGWAIALGIEAGYLKKRFLLIPFESYSFQLHHWFNAELEIHHVDSIQSTMLIVLIWNSCVFQWDSQHAIIVPRQRLHHIIPHHRWSISRILTWCLVSAPSYKSWLTTLLSSSDDVLSTVLMALLEFKGFFIIGFP